MPLLADVLAWSSGRPLWVQDALRRIFTSKDLEPADYDELFQLLLAAHGRHNPDAPVPHPLTQDHLPAQPTTATTCLTSISEMHCVNRFAPGSSIAFAPSGLTIVFGHNGSGKTGIARVLKQVCRARVKRPVLGNAFAADFATQVPTSVIRFQTDGVDHHLDWSMGRVAPSELQSIAVLDEVCAQDYVGNEGDVCFQPFGLGHLEALATNVFGELQRKVRSASEALDCNVARFASVASPSTDVGRLLARLTVVSNAEEVERLGTLGAADNSRLDELVAALEETNAEPKAAAAEVFATRLEEILRQAGRAKSYVDDRAASRWDERLNARNHAWDVRDKVEALVRGDHLPGTGGELWRRMFEAAKRFSLVDAYPGVPSPYLGEAALCPLCQTDLDHHAKERLAAFNAFVLSDAATDATKAETAFDAAQASVAGVDLSLALDEATHGEIAASAPEVLSILELARAEFNARRQWLLNRAIAREGGEPAGLTNEPGHLSIIRVIALRLRAQAAAFRAAMDHETRSALESERDQLAARRAFVPHKDAVLTVLANLRERQLLSRCATALDTAAISRQCRMLATRYITDALIEDMTKELRSLRGKGAAHTLRPRVERGRTLISMVMDGAQAKTSDILSDGEKRVAAIAYFLAELSQSGSTSGIVADDPVSSLDHVYRYQVARRLVVESTRRQVIVLTHDAVFLSALLSEMEQKGLAPHILSMECTHGVPGFNYLGLPWNNQSVSEKLSLLRSEQRRLVAEWTGGPTEKLRREMAEAYGRVRGTLERLIREHVFNKSVRPFDDQVKIERVASVAGFSVDEFAMINKVYLRCNLAIDAHDSSGEGGRDVPCPEDLLEDIASMQRLIDLAKARVREVERAIDVVRRATQRD